MDRSLQKAGGRGEARKGRALESRAGWPWRLLAVLLLAGVSAPSPAAQETNARPRLDYSSFRIITERNIFNANRSSRSSRNRDSRRPPKVDAFTLVGTLSYEKGPFAFFDGTSSDFKKALQLEGAIAGYKIKNINSQGVALQTGTNRIELRVGMQMRREDEGEWQVGASSGPLAAAGGTTTSQSAASGASGTSGELSDILKRLMQQRERETK
jgi:hypothetical protein